MSYYDTIDDDINAAKEILARGRTGNAANTGDGVTIYPADIYVAYAVLESFVAEIARLRVLLRDEHEADEQAAEIQLLTGEILELRRQLAATERERDDAIAQLPTDIPFDSQGRLLLNAYGRLCLEAGRADAQAEISRLQAERDEAVRGWAESMQRNLKLRAEDEAHQRSFELYRTASLALMHAYKAAHPEVGEDTWPDTTVVNVWAADEIARPYKGRS
jgi:hypothetical protein